MTSDEPTCHSTLVALSMRLDLFLKLSRICPRRSIAQELCDAGLVLVNGRPAKPAHSVKPSDRITLRRRDVHAEYRVLTVPETRNVARRDAPHLVELISEERLDLLD